MKRVCSVPGCDLPHKGKGLCRRHYLRVFRGNDVGPAERQRRPAGAGTIKTTGYQAIVSKGEMEYAHRLIAEKALGRKLRKGEEVHHVNGNESDNSPGNLVICPSRAYHMLLHKRQRALEECGNPNWRKCPYCKQYDAPENLSGKTREHSWFHRSCANERQNKARQARLWKPQTVTQ